MAWCALHRLGFATLVAAAAMWTSVAHANDPATAQALFDRGRALMEQQKWAEACVKLEESQRLDPAGGTLLHLALCRERQGRLATAWALYSEALAEANREGRKDRAKIASERISALTPRLPRMRVRVARANRELPAFELTRDGVPVGSAQWDEPVPVDPGTRVLKARADGHKTWTKTIDVVARPQEILVDVPELEKETATATATVTPPPPAAEQPKPPPPPRAPPEDASRGDTQRTVGIVVGAAGLVGLGVGGVFGLMSISKSHEADSECNPPDYRVCSEKGVAAGRDATSAGNVSTVAVIAGGALLAGGLIVYFTAPRAPRSVTLGPAAGTHGGSLLLRGSF